MARKKEKTVMNLYDLVPMRKREFEEADDGTVDVLLPRYGQSSVAKVLKMFLSKTPVRIRLDELGTTVWRLCDGERSVQQIGDELSSAFGERIEPVFDRLETFLLQMKKAEIIDWKN